MNAIDFLMRVQLSFFNFLYLTHLGITYCRPQGVCLCLYLSIMYRHPQSAAFLNFFLFSSCFFVLGPLKVNGFSHPWVIAYFSDPSSYLYMGDGFTFLNPHTGLLPLNLVEGWPKSQTIPLWPMLAGSCHASRAHASWVYGMPHVIAQYVPLQVLIVIIFPFHILPCIRILCTIMSIFHVMCLMPPLKHTCMHSFQLMCISFAGSSAA